MNPEEYDLNAARTDHDEYGYVKCGERASMAIQMLHAVMGLATEVGELTDELKRYIFYGKEMDYPHIAEEMGDIHWYLSRLRDVLGLSMESILEANINKLRVRFPEKWTSEDAIVRDLDAERVAIEEAFDPYDDDYLRGVHQSVVRQAAQDPNERISLSSPDIPEVVLAMKAIIDHARQQPLQSITRKQLDGFTLPVLKPDKDQVRYYESPAALYKNDELFAEWMKTIPAALTSMNNKVVVSNFMRMLRGYDWKKVGWLAYEQANREKVLTVAVAAEDLNPLV